MKSKFRTDSNDTLLIVKDSSNIEHVEILGKSTLTDYFIPDLEQGGLFEVMSSNNRMYDQQTRTKKPGHVPHLTAETIAQLITQGKIGRWYSNRNLTDGGIGLYEYLKSNMSDKLNIEDSQGRYKVTRKVN